MSLFGDAPAPGPQASSSRPPLADRMRPRTLDEVLGQDALLGPGAPLRRAIEADELRSLILWGPPGCGKTTIARLIAGTSRASFVPFSAVLSGIKEVREVMQRAALAKSATGRRTIVFVDEIHRFNKAQQDAFLPFLEDGTIVLIGATTENPSFEVIAALLSRSRVCRLEPLAPSDLVRLLKRALGDGERGLSGTDADVPDDVLTALSEHSQGDARAAFNGLEFAVQTAPVGPDGHRRVDRDHLKMALQKAALYHDRAGEQHFNLISALHKSMRNSDADATLYWLARMLVAGDDPLYVARRIVRFASEDVGLADPLALTLSLAAKDAVHFVGRPEADLALAQAAVYCALAPKSNAIYTAWKEVLATIDEGAADPVPMAIRNAVTGLMKAEGYGAGYEYAHDRDDAVTALECLPDRLRGKRFYRPTDRGLEQDLAARIAAWRAARSRLTDKG